MRVFTAERRCSESSVPGVKTPEKARLCALTRHSDVSLVLLLLKHFPMSFMSACLTNALDLASTKKVDALSS